MHRTMLSWPPPEEGNPYVGCLSGALRARGVAVFTHRYLAALSARPRGARWLHLHWPEWMVQHRDRLRYRLRERWLRALLDLSRTRGLRVAWTAHNLLGHDDPHRDLGLAARRALLARTEVVFGHFPSCEQDLRPLGFRGRFVLAPHPHVADAYGPAPEREAARRALGVGPGETLLVSFGAALGYKNLPALARALRALPDPHLRWHLRVRNSNPGEFAALQHSIANDPRVTLREGFVPREELVSLVTAADAVALPYRAFYTSGAAVLALTYGCAVLGPPEHHLGDLAARGHLVPLESPSSEGLGRALEVLRTRSEDAREAAQRYARSATWAQAAETVERHLFGGAR
jgi:glycosyltransferase involved in cell wall biosynthesis